MDELVFKNSPGKLVLLLLGSAGFVGVSFFLLDKVPVYKRPVLWAGVVFFSLCFVAILLRGITGEVPMRFTREGFEARCYGVPFVAWTHVEDAWTANVKGTRLLCLKLRNPDAVLERLSAFRRRSARINQKLGFGDICLAPTGMNPGFSEMLTYAGKYIPAIRNA
jgi:hypothetical protein